MSCIHTFITEYTTDLINPLESAYDQSLQIKLQRNTKLYIFIQRIVMCLKRSCCCTTCVGNQHRCFHFHEISACEEITDLLDDLGALDENFLAVLIHDQIHISLTIAGIRICQSVELLRQNL